MIEFVAGDILTSEEDYVAQGVAEGNQEGLGAGLTFKISRRWPEVQTAFKKHARSGNFVGGDVWTLPPASDRPGFVYMATRPGMYHATLPYLRKALRKLARWAHRQDVDSLALPKIGAGLGKLSWDHDVKPLFLEHLSAGATRFVVYETFRNAFEQQ